MRHVSMIDRLNGKPLQVRTSVRYCAVFCLFGSIPSPAKVALLLAPFPWPPAFAGRSSNGDLAEPVADPSPANGRFIVGGL